MFRNAQTHLTIWKDRPDRKPLVIRGARQVGKSHLVRAFATAHFEHLVELNFERQPQLAELFASNDPKRIMQLLELQLDVDMQPGKTLLFLDEIQAAGDVLATLRYFYEDQPALHVIAASSLLEFVLAEHRFSMPVGRIEYLHLGPMSFEEYLLAAESQNLIDFLNTYTFDDKIPTPLHDKLMQHVRRYSILGGMPAVLAAYLESNSLRDVDAAQQSILATFADDFGKYGVRIDHQRLRKVFDALPGEVGRRFKYVRVDREARSATVSAALTQLCLARLAYRVHHSASNGLPLGAETRESVFKILFLDIGLMASACGLSLLDIDQIDDLNLVNQGALSEQFVGQHLLYAQPSYRTPELYYWTREKSNSSAEVDYVIPAQGRIIPIEVKSGKSGRLKSLQLFAEQKACDLAARFNSDQPSLTKAAITYPGAKRESYRLVSLPFYMVQQVERVVGKII